MTFYFRFPSRSYKLFPNLQKGQLDLLSFKTNGSRTLLSDTTTNIESYSRQRIFKIDQLQENGKTTLFKKLEGLSCLEEAEEVIPLILDSFHCAETEGDCHAIESVIRLLRHEKETGHQEFSFGAILLRMFHFLRMSDKAMALYRDHQLKNLFEDNTCHILLMDLLYKSKQYHDVMEVFAGLQRFDTNCYTLAFGALYHIDTPDSLQQLKSLFKGVQASKHRLQRRAVMFSAMLALNQGKPKDALEYLSLCHQNVVSKNIKLMCHCKLRHLQEVFKTIDKFLAAAEDTTQLMRNRIYRDTWQEIQAAAVLVGDKCHDEKLRKLELKLCQAGILSQQNMSIFLERIIPGDKDYKKERAKRFIER